MQLYRIFPKNSQKVFSQTKHPICKTVANFRIFYWPFMRYPNYHQLQKTSNSIPSPPFDPFQLLLYQFVAKRALFKTLQIKKNLKLSKHNCCREKSKLLEETEN